MTNYNTVFQIPERAVINRKLTKVFFTKNFDLLAGEKKFLKNDITEMLWLANIKPTNSNIPAWVDKTYCYDELQVMICTIKNKDIEKTSQSCAELFQKYIPYPLVLLTQNETHFTISTCDKRINQVDKNKRTVGNYYHSSILSQLYKKEVETAFLEQIAFKYLDKTNLKTTYNNYTQAIINLKTAQLTGTYTLRSHARSQEDVAVLDEIDRVEQECQSLRSQIKKESRFNEKVPLNMALQQKREKIKTLQAKLKITQ